MVRKSKGQVYFFLTQIGDLFSLPVTVMSANIVMSNCKFSGFFFCLFAFLFLNERVTTFFSMLFSMFGIWWNHDMNSVGHAESQTTNAESYLSLHVQ